MKLLHETSKLQIICVRGKMYSSQTIISTRKNNVILKYYKHALLRHNKLCQNYYIQVFTAQLLSSFIL